MAVRFYRIQDAEGRGPYRPGFSREWAEAEGPPVLPWWIELGIPVGRAARMIPPGMYGGSAFASIDHLERWFLPAERNRLGSLGYYIVRFRPDKVIAETPTQVVFAQNYPLAVLPVFARLGQSFDQRPDEDAEGFRFSLSHEPIHTPGSE